MSVERVLRGILVLLSSVAYIGFIIWIGVTSLNYPNYELEKDDKGALVVDEAGNTKLARDSEGNKIPLDPPEIPGEITTLLSIMGAALAVHTGAVLGIEMQTPGGEGRRLRVQRRQAHSLLYRYFRVDNPRGFTKVTNEIVDFLSGEIPDLGALIYVAGVLIAVCFFFFGENFAEAAAPYLRNSWSVMVGIIAGIWSAGGAKTIKVPDVVLTPDTISKGRAQEILEAYDLKPKWTGAAAGTMTLDQRPEAYSLVEPGSEIEVTLK